jgi:hypothetical protein
VETKVVQCAEDKRAERGLTCIYIECRSPAPAGNGGKLMTMQSSEVGPIEHRLISGSAASRSAALETQRAQQR